MEMLDWTGLGEALVMFALVLKYMYWGIFILGGLFLIKFVQFMRE